jgi:hypothetical protein
MKNILDSRRNNLNSVKQQNTSRIYQTLRYSNWTLRFELDRTPVWISDQKITFQAGVFRSFSR